MHGRGHAPAGHFYTIKVIFDQQVENNKLRKILSYSTILLFIFVVISLAFNPVLKKRMLDYTFFQMGLSDKWAGEDKSYLAPSF